MNLKSFAVAFILVLSSLNFFAQPKDYYSLPFELFHYQWLTSSINTLTTSLDVEKNYWLPAVEIVGLNFRVRGL